MKEIQMKELQRIIKFLDGAGCQYKIVTDDGQEFGDLQAAKQKTQRQFPYGAFRSYIDARIDLSAEVGSVHVVDCGEYPPDRIQSAICSRLSEKWGSGNYTTYRNGNTVEILRTNEITQGETA